MKSSLALLVLCVVLALVSNTEAGEGKKGEGWSKMMNGKCKGMMNFKDDKEWKDCIPKEGADGDDAECDMDKEGGKKGKGMKMMKCFMEAKKIIDGNKFQLETAKSEITSKLSDQSETATTVTKLLDECAKENKLSELDFSDGNKESWKALMTCKHKCMKPCME